MTDCMLLQQPRKMSRQIDGANDQRLVTDEVFKVRVPLKTSFHTVVLLNC